MPNVDLVAHLLHWLCAKYDPHLQIDPLSSTAFADDRVRFFRACIIFLANKAHIKLHPKRLYSADTQAALELSKVVQALHDANHVLQSEDAQPTAFPVPTFAV